MRRFAAPWKREIVIENQRDERATLARHFHSKDSYVSIAGHDYLAGILDHAFRRAEVYRQAGGEVQLVIEPGKQRIQHWVNVRSALCQGCLRPHPVSWVFGQWHHNVKSYGGRRCDCLKCGLWVCSEWHNQHHNRVIKWSSTGTQQKKEY
jgi:hypothetical protein